MRPKCSVWLSGLALCAVSGATPACADNRPGSGMTAEALARDRAAIRKLNQDQLASVQRRDAGYAREWRGYADAPHAEHGAVYSSDQHSYRAAQHDYAQQRKQYEQAMRDWRADVAACQSGDYDRCDQ